MLPSGSCSWCIHFFPTALFSKLKKLEVGMSLLSNWENWALTKAAWTRSCIMFVRSNWCRLNPCQLQGHHPWITLLLTSRISLSGDTISSLIALVQLAVYVKAERLHLSLPNIPALTQWLMSSPLPLPCFPEDFESVCESVIMITLPIKVPVWAMCSAVQNWDRERNKATRCIGL